MLLVTGWSLGLGLLITLLGIPVLLVPRRRRARRGGRGASAGRRAARHAAGRIGPAGLDREPAAEPLGLARDPASWREQAYLLLRFVVGLPTRRRGHRRDRRGPPGAHRPPLLLRRRRPAVRVLGRGHLRRGDPAGAPRRADPDALGPAGHGVRRRLVGAGPRRARSRRGPGRAPGSAPRAGGSPPGEDGTRALGIHAITDGAISLASDRHLGGDDPGRLLLAVLADSRAWDGARDPRRARAHAVAPARPGPREDGAGPPRGRRGGAGPVLHPHLGGDDAGRLLLAGLGDRRRS